MGIGPGHARKRWANGPRLKRGSLRIGGRLACKQSKQMMCSLPAGTLSTIFPTTSCPHSVLRSNGTRCHLGLDFVLPYLILDAVS
jgi:hypothetical protein